tara:strand:- start:110 stop:631 length:522 start_codon:yes stop_codon:yes gene_type:complete
MKKMFSRKIAAFKAAQIKPEDREPNTHIRGGGDGEVYGYTNRQTAIVGMQMANNEESYRQWTTLTKILARDLVRMPSEIGLSKIWIGERYEKARTELAQEMAAEWLDVYKAHAGNLLPYLEQPYDPVIDGGNIILELLRLSINSVDWQQLAERFLETEIENQYKNIESQYSGS